MRRQRKRNKDALETKRTRDAIPHIKNYIKEPPGKSRNGKKQKVLTKKDPL